MTFASIVLLLFLKKKMVMIAKAKVNKLCNMLTLPLSPLLLPFGPCPYPLGMGPKGKG
jgi:hypothetical protein